MSRSIFERYLETPLGVPAFLNNQYQNNGCNNWAPVEAPIPTQINNKYIIDPDDLDLDDFNFDFDNKIIGYNKNTYMTVQVLYSFLKELWKIEPGFIRYSFPMLAYTPEEFDFVDSWMPDESLIQSLVYGGFRINRTQQTYASFSSLGEGTHSLVIVTGSFGRRLELRKQFLIRSDESVYILQNVVDWKNKAQYWEEVPVGPLIGVQHFGGSCYRIPVP